MSGGGRTIYVAGAGIAGLSLALAKFGATVVVLERSRSIQEIGAGLQVSPNARRVLNQLGLDRAIRAHSFEPAGIDVYPFRAERPLTTLALGAGARERFGAPYAVMHRADLAEILFRACRRFANIDVLFGVRDFDAASHARGTTVSVEEDGGKSREGRAFALVGADGVHSVTRRLILHGPEAAYSGHVAWRATLPLDALAGTVALDRTSVIMGPGYHAVCYPLPHRNRINLVLFAPEKSGSALSEAPPRNPTLPWAALRSARFDAIEAAGRDSWGSWPVFGVETPTWHGGGVGLIGDAAHAMLPYQAQGAAMAIEDAAILAPLLVTEPTAESAFARFAAMRRPRIARVAKVSRRNGFAFHLEWPFTLARDAAIRLQGPRGHLKRLHWLYAFDAAPEVVRAPRARG